MAAPGVCSRDVNETFFRDRHEIFPDFPETKTSIPRLHPWCTALLGHKWGTITSEGNDGLGPSNVILASHALAKAVLRGAGCVLPLENRRCYPGQFLKICFQNLSFWCYEHQKFGLCWCEIWYSETRKTGAT